MAATWSAPPRAGESTAVPPDGPGWLPLGQSWRESPDARLAPAWARVSWSSAALHLDAVFGGPPPRNRATRLNERTWELGDCCEFFLSFPDDSSYLEIHVTPENQRLQLRWSPDGLARVRAGREMLETFLVPQPDWVTSRTRHEKSHWFTRLTVPAAVAHSAGVLRAGQRFHAAVCRYHWLPGEVEPVLSSTAPLSAPGFHQPGAWHTLVLADPAGGAS